MLNVKYTRYEMYAQQQVMGKVTKFKFTLFQNVNFTLTYRMYNHGWSYKAPHIQHTILRELR
jgi:hypothetical protein